MRGRYLCVCVCEHARDSQETERERGATFIVTRGVPSGEAEVVLIVCPLVQRPGWSVSHTEAVRVGQILQHR